MAQADLAVIPVKPESSSLRLLVCGACRHSDEDGLSLPPSFSEEMEPDLKLTCVDSIRDFFPSRLLE